MAAGRLKQVAVLCLLLLAAACAREPAATIPAAPPPVAVPPSPDLRYWPGRNAIQSACLNDLEALGAKFEMINQAEPGKNGCTLENGVRLLSTTLELSRPAEMTCPLAVRLMEFERDVLKPTALRYFGKELRRLNHAGAFVCKRTNGTNRVSEHGHGRAIDFWGFSLRDEVTLSVKQQWKDRGAAGQYLREVARRSCDYFNVVLTPNADSDHLDHLHVDIGPWKRCGY